MLSAAQTNTETTEEVKSEEDTSDGFAEDEESEGERGHTL